MEEGGLNIVADEDMPMVKSLFGPFGNVTTCPGREISSAHLTEADVLLVRSVTSVNHELLNGSKVKFVGSATIGVDHVDTTYLSDNNISFAAAPGCNADAVIQYVLSAICRLEPNWQHKSVGIVGCGNVGGRLYTLLWSLGISCLGYDPFLDSQEFRSTTFEDILACDIICLHTPLTTQGAYPTYHLFDQSVLRRLRPGTALINAGRGDVIDNQALLSVLSSGAELSVALDVWSQEPNIDPQLMELVSVATPHIAGHSLEGKIKGTTMVFDSFLDWIGQHCNRSPMTQLDAVALEGNNQTLNELILASYDVLEDATRMRKAMSNRSESVAMVFDRLRREYPLRREFSSTLVSNKALTSQDIEKLSLLGFSFDDIRPEISTDD
jgi:erythronate-4-phosphate dehydrogenase